ncbi:unnamed protein product [Urochloa humidicola]
MAGLENPGVGELAADATPERDGIDSTCGTQLCIACFIGAFMAVCILPVFYYRAHRTAGPGIQVLAGFLLTLGTLGLIAAGCCCTFLIAQDCVYGNLEGRHQRDEEAALPQ